jgi:tetratricopeptide (TPR) repeat protein
MNRTAIFLSLLITFGLSEWTDTPPKRAIACESSAHHPESSDRPAPLFNNLGNHHHQISTKNPLAQRYFNQGLILSYGFNHAEAERSFREAARLAPDCAMCYWGIALVRGPNINAPMDDAAVSEAFAAVQKALELAPKASEVEQAYIQALSLRYAPKPVKDRTPLEQVYANAMRELSQRTQTTWML